MTAEPAAPTLRRRALLIATGTYDDPGLAALRAPTGDVDALAEVLEDGAIGEFEVSRLVDEPTEDLKKEIEGFFAEARRDDLLLLYFSCHGVLSQSRFYFATATTALNLLRATAIEDSFVNDVMRHSRANSIVLILDCCHSGAFGKGLVPKSGTVDFEHRFEGRGRVTLAASTGLEYAFEETDEAIGVKELDPAAPGSLFTRCLVQGLATGDADTDGDGDISVDELYDYARDRMREDGAHQTPGIAPDERSEIVIARTRRQMRDAADHRRRARGSPRRPGDRPRRDGWLTRTAPVPPPAEPPTEVVLEPEPPEVHRARRPRRGALLVAAAAAVVAAVVVVWLVIGGPSDPASAYDFDGDGDQEIVIAPVSADAPELLIHRGPDGDGVTTISAEDAGVPDASRGFGAGLTSADFDADGYADLAVGTPRLNVVAVLYGTPDGVPEPRGGPLQAADFDLPSSAGQYGLNILARDLNDDGFGDLVVGAPGDRGASEAGAVQVIFGGEDGLRTDTAELLEAPSGVSSFGGRLRSGDIDGDGDVDLVEGAPATESGGAGHLAFCPGSPQGPSSCRALPSVEDPSPTSGLAVADVNGDGRADIVQAGGELPEETGGLRLWLGGDRGPSTDPIPRTAGELGLGADVDDPTAEFPASVDAGPIDGDRYADIVVGAPGHDQAAGAVAVIRGGPDGFADGGHRLIWSEVSDQDDRLGTQLAMLSLEGRGEGLDVAAAAEGAGFDTAVQVLRGGEFVELPGLNGAAQGSAASIRVGRTPGR